MITKWFYWTKSLISDLIIESSEPIANFLKWPELIGFWQQTETEQITEAERRFDES